MKLRYFQNSLAYWLTLVLLANMGVSSRQAQADWPAIQIDGLSVVGGQAGSMIQVQVLAGKRYESATTILTPFPNSLEKPLSSDTSVEATGQPSFRIEIPSNTSEGFYPIRLRGPSGVSNSRNLWITKESWRAIPPDNTEAERALEIESEIVFSGHFEARKEYYFKFYSPANTRWTIDGQTQSVDSQATLLVDIRGPQNKLITTYNRRFNHQTLIVFDSQEAGSYRIKISDQLYRGGPEFPYAIRLRRQPLEDKTIEIVQNSLNKWMSNPKYDSTHLIDPSLLLSANVGATPPWTEHHEFEFAESRSMPIERGTDGSIVVQGQFENNRDMDAFVIEMEAGKTIAIDVLSHQMGQATDISLSIFQQLKESEGESENWKLVLNCNDPEPLGTADLTLRSLDPHVLFTPTESRRYRIVLYDQQRSPIDVYQVADAKNYLLQIREPKPDYELLAYFASPASKPEKSTPVSPTLFKNQIACVDVIAIRKDGFSLPIQVDFENLPTGVACRPAIIGSNSTRASLMIYSNVNQSDTLLTPLQIVGTTRLTEGSSADRNIIEGSLERRTAFAAEIACGPLPTRPFPIVKLIPNLCLATNSSFEVPIAIQIGDGQTSDNTIGNGSMSIPIRTESLDGTPQKVKLPIRLIREKGAGEEVVIQGFRLPNGVKLSELTISAGKSQGDLEMTIENRSKVDDFDLVIIGETMLNSLSSQSQNAQFYSLPLAIKIDR